MSYYNLIKKIDKAIIDAEKLIREFENLRIPTGNGLLKAKENLQVLLNLKNRIENKIARRI